MDVEIKIEDLNCETQVHLSGCTEPEKIWIKLTKAGNEVSACLCIEELKHAIRKISAK